MKYVYRENWKCVNSFVHCLCHLTLINENELTSETDLKHIIKTLNIK